MKNVTAMTRLSALRGLIELALLAAVIVLVVFPVRKAKGWHASLVYSVPTTQKVVALTFDDGPHPKYTSEILDILDKYKVKATFFMVGKRMEQRPDLVKEVVRRGHVVGNHTYSHPRNMEANTRGQVAREIELCEQVIEMITGKRTHLFRPPRGLVDGTAFQIAEEEGYRTILWTVCADHHDAPTPELMAKRVLDHIRPGAIILAHDGSFNSRWKDVEATPLIIKGLRKRGYRFVTIPRLLEIGEEARGPH